MRRLLVIVLAFVLTLCGVVLFARARWLEPAMNEGRVLYQRRELMRRLVQQRPPADRRHVLFMGDSSTRPVPGNPSWPYRLEPALRSGGVVARHDAVPGQDLFHHYCMLPALLEARPDVVVIVVNMRIMFAGRRDGRMIDLCSFLPAAVLPRSLLLPWYDRGVSVVRLLVTKTLDVPDIEQSLLFVEGLRRIFVDAWLPTEPPNVGQFVTTLQRMAGRYDQPLTPRQPLVRMLHAVVAEISRAGAMPLVVVTPIPMQWLETMFPIDPREWQRRMDVLRTTVEDAGGELVDMHALLDPSGFRDKAGHMTPTGHVRIANTVAPTLHRMLGLPAPLPLRLPSAPAAQRPEAGPAP